MITLRDYQLSMIDKIRENMLRHKAILCQLSTGAGKTALASEMIRRSISNGSSVFFIVHRKDLVSQTSNVFSSFGIPHSFIASGRGYNRHNLVQVCSVETLKRRIDKYPVPKIIFVDECHLAASTGWSKVIEFYKQSGCWVVGLTASPWRLDSRGLGKLFDTMICGPSMRELISQGYLSNYKYYAPSKPDLSGIGIVGGDYNKKDLINRIESDNVIVGNAIYHYQKYASGLRAVVYCPSISHSKRVADEFCLSGIPAKHIDGDTPDDERIQTAIDFASGKILVLCNVELITTGYDLASQSGQNVTIEAIIMLRPTKSLSLYLQMVGRGLRKKDFPAVILDHASNALEHGLPCDDRHWTLEDREKGVRKTGDRVEPVRHCWPGCGFCHKPAPVCPNCGKVYEVQSREIEEVDGELAEIDRERERKERRIEVGRARTIADLQRIAVERGYSPGWVYQYARVKGIKT